MARRQAVGRGRRQRVRTAEAGVKADTIERLELTQGDVLAITPQTIDGPPSIADIGAPLLDAYVQLFSKRATRRHYR